MEFRELGLLGVYEITLEPRSDARGYFTRTYAEEDFRRQHLATGWVHENQSYSIKMHTVRGLHFQRPPRTETKLVRVTSGAILDVAVDLRRGSATYGGWCAVELTAQNLKMLYVPKGFAHGFCTLTAHTVVQYKVDDVYDTTSEGGLLWNDPTIGIEWPTQQPTISDRDAVQPAFEGFQSPFPG